MPKETQQVSEFTQQPIIFHKKAKSRVYTTVRSKPACIRGNRRETRVYTRLFAVNPRAYAEIVEKPACIRDCELKTGVQEERCIK